MENFSFNGETKEYLDVLRGSIREPWSPVSREFQELPNRSGVYLKKKRKTLPRPFPIPVFLKTASIIDLQKIKEDLAVWLIHDEPKPLIPDDEPDRTYYAVIDGSFDPEDIVRWSKGTIPFICPDPFKYGAEDTVPLDAGPINNVGTAETPLVITATINTVATEYKITHSNGKYVRVIWDFKVGDILEIDLKKRKVTINGVVHMTAYDWRSSPFMLLPGANPLTVDPVGVATTQINFRPRWL